MPRVYVCLCILGFFARSPLAALVASVATGATSAPASVEPKNHCLPGSARLPLLRIRIADELAEVYMTRIQKLEAIVR